MEFIKKVFDEYYNGEKNFMTPHVYDYTKIDFGKFSLLIEKSSGTGLFDTELYGCSVLIFHNGTGIVRKIDLSKSFNSKKEMEDYISSIDENMVHSACEYGELKYF